MICVKHLVFIPGNRHRTSEARPCVRAVLLLLLFPLLPESPHWLAVSGDTAAAEALLARIAEVNGVSMLPGRLRHHPPLHIATAGALAPSDGFTAPP